MKKLIYLFVLNISITVYCPGQENPHPCDRIDFEDLEMVSCGGEHPCGIYYVPPIDEDFTDVETDLQDKADYYDGIFVRLSWDMVEHTGQGDYIWDAVTCDPTVISNYCEFAETYSPYKQISLAICAGDKTPLWLKENLFNAEYAQDFIHIGKDGSKAEDTLKHYPAPYAPDFISAFNDMIKSLADYLNTCNTPGGPPLIDYITMIKITGVNMETAETRIPYQDPGFCEWGTQYPSYHPASDAPYQWLNLMGGSGNSDPYSPQKLVTAWRDMATNIKNEFDGKFANITVIPDIKAFPPIDCNSNEIFCGGNACNADPGCDPHTYDYKHGAAPELTPDNADNPMLTMALAQNAVDLFYPCVSIQNSFLNENPNTAYAEVVFPDAWMYALIGYQEQEGNSGLGTACDFADMIQNGIDHHASYIELFPAAFEEYKQEPCSATSVGNVLQWAHEEVTCQFEHRKQSAGASKKNSLTASYYDSQIHIKNESNTGRQCVLKLYDALGREILNSALFLKPGDNAISPGALSPSVYFVRLIDDTQNNYLNKILTN